MATIDEKPVRKFSTLEPSADDPAIRNVDQSKGYCLRSVFSHSMEVELSCMFCRNRHPMQVSLTNSILGRESKTNSGRVAVATKANCSPVSVF
jgi:hypothetical protein